MSKLYGAIAHVLAWGVAAAAAIAKLFTSTRIFLAAILGRTPLIGKYLRCFLLGGNTLRGATLSRSHLFPGGDDSGERRLPYLSGG